MIDSAPEQISQSIAPEVHQNPQNPWEKTPFGSLTGEIPVRTAAAPHTILPIVTKAEPSQSQTATPAESSGKTPYQLRQERAEAMTEAKLRVKLDREAIANILRNNPNLLPPGFSFGDWKESEQEHQANLQRTLDAISRLPETVDFQPGITLVVGENGLGKSTLARSIQLAALIQYDIDEGKDPGRVTNSVLNPRGYSPTDPPMNSPAKHIAPFIHVEELQTGMMPGRYEDAAVYMGNTTRLTNEMDNGEIKRTEDDLTIGRSHRQTVDQLFERLKRDKGRGDAHPQLYFIDEPEVGMSPKRHRALKQEMMDVTNGGSILIVPTNSIILVDSDLPRIDLEYPERGIHRPSEYPAEPVSSSTPYTQLAPAA